MNAIETLGIVGMILILIGFGSKDEKIIRIFDTLGAMFFVAYGAITKTYSTLLLNAILIFINIVHLKK